MYPIHKQHAPPDFDTMVCKLIIGMVVCMEFDPSMQIEVIPGVEKIAILRANAVGDFIFTLPAMEAVRQAYPEAEIVLVGRDWHYDFLNGRPGPWDRVVKVPDENLLRGKAVSRDSQALNDQFLADMQAEHFDLALQMYGGGRYSNPFIREFKARLTAGLRSADAGPLDRSVPYIYFQSEVMRYLEVAALVGAKPVTLSPSLQLTREDFHEAAPFLTGEQPVVALQPGAGDPRRRWPVEKFAALGDALVNAGATVLVTGADFDRPLVDGVVDGMRATALPVYNQLSLGGLAALFRQCAVMVGNDSGPVHLAAAAGGCTVPIFWGPNLITAGVFTRQKHRPVLSWECICPECGANTLVNPCTHPVSFVSGIPVEDVLTNVLDLMREQETSAGRQ